MSVTHKAAKTTPHSNIFIREMHLRHSNPENKSIFSPIYKGMLTLEGVCIRTEHNFFTIHIDDITEITMKNK